MYVNTTPISLSPEQCRAVEARGPLLVDAPPGGGKTSVLAWRVAHLARTEGADLSLSILAVTFSVRAARELRERLDQLLPSDHFRLVTVATLHALGLRILREFGHLLGYASDEHRRTPGVCGTAHARELLAQAVEHALQSCTVGSSHLAQHIAHLPLDELADYISAYKAEGAYPEHATAQASIGDPLGQAATQCYAAYQCVLLQHNLSDFDDLILQPLILLRRDAETRGYYQTRWQHILVDEFQDLSPAQYDLIRMLAGTHHSLTAIGDPHQSVYAFRHAMGAAGFERFRRDFHDAQVIYLPHNYRSTGNIVALAETLLNAHQHSQDASAPARMHQSAIKPPGAPIYLFPAPSEHQEAELVVEQIIAAVSAGFARYDECAILCRTNVQVRLIERTLVHHKVPCVVVGEGSFFDHVEVRLVCACLRLALDFTADSLAVRDLLDAYGWLSETARATVQGDDPDLIVIHLFEHERYAGLSPVDRDAIIQAQNALLSLDEHKEDAPADLIHFILADENGGLGYRTHLLRTADGGMRLERVAALVKLARDHSTVQSFLDELDTMSGYDPLSLFTRDRVQIMTLHAAKGLEFKLVFIVGMEEGLIPHHHATQTERGRQEELRLVYVGLTRASDVLCLSFARERGGHPRQSSPWLRGLPNVELRRKPDWHAMAT